jgi:hypothetical protein
VHSRNPLLLGALCAVVASPCLLCRLVVPARDRTEASAEEEEALRTHRLEFEARLLRDSMRANRAIRDDLVAGRLSLAEALAAFRAEDARRPAHLRMRPDSFPGATPEERYARMVLSQVRWHLQGRPCQSAVLDRLEAELQALLSREPPRTS